MSCTREEIVNEAKKYIGFNESNGTYKTIIDGYNEITPLPRGYRVKYSDPWCATFISFVAKKCKALDIIPAECSCGKMLLKAHDMGIFNENDTYSPNLGDIVLYDWSDNGKGDCTGYPDHVGIVSRLSKTSFTVIEGNKSNAVSTRTLGYNARYIRGWILPNYASNPNSTVQPTNDLDKICKLVIRGDYGNGSERVSRLTSLGYDPEVVQARVNEILLG